MTIKYIPRGARVSHAAQVAAAMRQFDAPSEPEPVVAEGHDWKALAAVAMVGVGLGAVAYAVFVGLAAL